MSFTEISKSAPNPGQINAIDRGEIDAVRFDLLRWSTWRGFDVRYQVQMIAENLALDEPPLPILAGQVEHLAALVGRKAKM